MKRPLLLKLAPNRWKGLIYYRFYRKQPERFAPLFEKADLALAPGCQMLSLVPTDYVSECIALMGFFELDLSRRMVERAQSGGRLVDVGANMGYFPLLWLSTSPRTTCLAFEPVKRNQDIIRRNMIHNRFEDRLQLIPMAAGERKSTMLFDPGDEEQTGWGSLAVTDQARSYKVDVVRLDDVITDNEPIDVLKIDTEGADPLVLRGAERLLQQHQIREIFFEHNRPGLENLGLSDTEAQDFLRSHEYDVECLDDPSARVTTWRAIPANG
ncbi:MAG: FkbM family methyltransferase [Planctomycetaceae bacterium]|nr:FkbM family methyltransferase [Planctomycetaceae bacterium]